MYTWYYTFELFLVIYLNNSSPQLLNLELTSNAIKAGAERWRQESELEKINLAQTYPNKYRYNALNEKQYSIVFVSASRWRIFLL